VDRLSELDRLLLMHSMLREKPRLWELFTGADEYHPSGTDEYGRVTFLGSGRVSIARPVLSDYLVSRGFRFQYPHGKSWALLLTHDVDDIDVQNRHLLLSAWNFPRNGDLKGMYHLLKGRLDSRYSPYRNFREIVALEQRYQAVSTFFFLPNPDDIFGRKYSLSDIGDILGFLRDQGCEIAFHTPYFHYDDAEVITADKVAMEQQVGRAVVGARNHVLCFSTPQTWEALAAAGFGYDSSYGYHDMVGFRNGLCHPFIPFNVTTQQAIPIVELPLVVHDFTLRFLMKQRPDLAWMTIKQLLDATRQCQGVFTLLWHTWTFSFPTSIGTLFDKEWTTLYEKILAYASEQGAWITSCEEFFTYCQTKEYIAQP
jgi:peptidoglycan/xylan/chitin deacetylase (PgdA/CDA1 family)